MDYSEQESYIYTTSLLFAFRDAVVPRDLYKVKPGGDGASFTLWLKPRVELIPDRVCMGETKGFIFHFQDDMTPRPFDEHYGGWKVSYFAAGKKTHTLLEASPTHTYLCVRLFESVEEVDSGDHDLELV